MAPSHVRSFVSATAAEEVRRQLGRLLASPWFARSGRLRRFLQFGVDHALAGTREDAKEYLVGVEVYDRAADYDPRVDPIVRVEARRLRAKLDAYYASTGKSDPILIRFPKGVYTATFVERPEFRRVETPEKSLPSIAVAPFADLSADTRNDGFSIGLTEELIVLLTRVQGLQVMTAHPHRENPQALLRGSCRRKGVRVRVTAQLIDTRSGVYLWSEAFERGGEHLPATQEEIARAIVEVVRLKLALPAAAVSSNRSYIATYAVSRCG